MLRTAGLRLFQSNDVKALILLFFFFQVDLFLFYQSIWYHHYCSVVSLLYFVCQECLYVKLPPWITPLLLADLLATN